MKSSVPPALGSPIAASIATPRSPDHASVQETSCVAVDITSASSPNLNPSALPAANHVAAPDNSTVSHAPAAASDAPCEVKPHHVVGLSTRAQQLMAELAAEDESFGAIDFLEPAMDQVF